MTYSFVLIAYNEENTIITCIQSILAQDELGEDFEIIIADDGSRDSTRQLVTDFAAQNHRVRLIGDGKNHGRGFGRYSGVNAAQGEYVIMVDTDIVLPRNWLAIALAHTNEYDVVGGIAVPDGDVAYVYRRFKLKPKTVMGTTTITGNNGLYKREVFKKLNFDPNLREGEDVDFNNRALPLGVREFCIPGLTVEHQEHKSFPRSMLWLYQSGVGATRQFIRFREIRLPDLAFAATIATLALAIAVNIIYGSPLGYAIPLLGIIGASLLHLRGKFYLGASPFGSLAALVTNSLLIFCYYVGRLTGFPIYWKQHRKHGGSV